MIKTEFHSHTIYSKDSLVTPQQLVETCRRKGIDRVVITDHNSIAGAVEAQGIAPGLVIIGEEIMTTRGEILAVFVTDKIPAGLSPHETIHRLREQGAFISVSHPFDVTRSGHWQMEDLLDIAPFVDAIETFNARCLLPSFNQKAQQFAQEHGLASTVGSDAHAAFELGRATLMLPKFSNADELREIIRQGEPQVRSSSPLVRLTSRYAVIRKKITPSLIPR